MLSVDYISIKLGGRKAFHPFEKQYIAVTEHWKNYSQIHFLKTRKVMISGVYPYHLVIH